MDETAAVLTDEVIGISAKDFASDLLVFRILLSGLDIHICTICPKDNQVLIVSKKTNLFIGNNSRDPTIYDYSIPNMYSPWSSLQVTDRHRAYALKALRDNEDRVRDYIDGSYDKLSEA